MHKTALRIAGAIACALLCVSSVSMAQTVPQPPQRPPNASGGGAGPTQLVPPTGAPAQGTPAQGTPGAAPRVGPPPSVSRPAAADAPARAPRLVRGAQPARLTPEQTELVRRISATYNGIREMRGEFTQFDPAGTRSTGQFFLTKPGRVRFQYAAPSPVEVIADGRHLAVRDKRLNTQDIYLIEQTPLRHLLSANLDLAAQTRIISMQTEGDLITLALEERGAMVEGQITLFFDAGDLSIRQWTTTDATGQETAVRVRNVVVNQRNDPQLFLVDQSGGR